MKWKVEMHNYTFKKLEKKQRSNGTTQIGDVTLESITVASRKKSIDQIKKSIFGIGEISLF